MPLVSVVMPAYNVADYIGNAISSLQAQTLQDWELIVVNDASTDATPEIVSKLAESDNRIKLKSLPRNSGFAFEPRSLAISLATAPWISTLDADDTLAPTFLESMLQRQKETGAEVVYSKMVMHRDLGSEHEYSLPKADFDSSKVYVGKEIVKDTIYDWAFGCNGNLIRTDLLQKWQQDPILTPVSTHTDELLTRVILYNAKSVAFDVHAEYIYGDNPTSITRKLTLKKFDLLKNDIVLLDYIQSKFGVKSATTNQVHKELFKNVYTSIYILNQMHGLSTSEEKIAKSIIRQAYSLIDWSVLKPSDSSPIKYYLLRLGLFPATVAVKLHALIKRK